jgi:ketosteroid isomerase-like protein
MTGRHETSETVPAFFARYAAALLARDEKAMARLYAVPALILFPGNPIPVSDASQTEAFFASAWAQYDGVEQVDKRVEILAEGPATVWADVTWSYDGAPRERMCYQLVDGPAGWQIAVLTPLAQF